jgi:hypothetical protein
VHHAPISACQRGTNRPEMGILVGLIQLNGCVAAIFADPLCALRSMRCMHAQARLAADDLSHLLLSTALTVGFVKSEDLWGSSPQQMRQRCWVTPRLHMYPRHDELQRGSCKYLTPVPCRFFPCRLHLCSSRDQHCPGVSLSGHCHSIAPQAGGDLGVPPGELFCLPAPPTPSARSASSTRGA